MPTILDVHNHYYPPAYLKALQAGESAVEVSYDEQGNPRLHYPGDYNIAVPGQRDLAVRVQMLDATGIDLQVYTMTTPGVHVESPATAVRLAQMVNDDFAAGMARYPGRFSALATLPLNDPAASVRELERACRQLHLPGAMLFSNVNGIALADPRFWPLYELADELGAILHIHPTDPVGVEAMREYWLMPLVGFLMDTTLAAAQLVFSGVPERFPRIRWVLSHLGGAIPYLAERLDRGYRAFPDCRAHIPRPPSEYLRQFYFDTVNFDPEALMLAVGFAGAGHLLAGSDYAHQLGSPALMLQSLRALPLPEADRDLILGGNARRLYQLALTH
ncbi:MAG TPA: amidohydrolase family protein [Terriglobales bacterium]|nr:amidohydrolase family protein [Terriglobales bacterium]